jgi:large subunit ribosomal protein L3
MAEAKRQPRPSEVKGEADQPPDSKSVGKGQPSRKGVVPEGFKGLLGRKLGCSALFQTDGSRVAVTLVEAGPCTVTDRLTREKNGYAALQIGYRTKKMQRATKPLQGHFKKAQSGAFYLLREFRVGDLEGFELGQTVSVSVFKPGDRVDVTGT